MFMTIVYCAPVVILRASFYFFQQQHIALTILVSIFNVDDNDDDDNRTDDGDVNVIVAKATSAFDFIRMAVLDDQMYSHMCITQNTNGCHLCEKQKGKTSFECYLVKMEFTLNS